MRTRFITSSDRVSTFPDTDIPELAFVGRSNVGKSALLNGLTGTRIARTSRTPGRTQLINFFEVHTGDLDYMLADLPGYGYAKAPLAVRTGWQALVESYLGAREPLCAVLLLLDLRRVPDADDIAIHSRLVESLSPRRVTVQVVGTKSDKCSKAALKPVLHAFAAELSLSRDAIIPTSAANRTGLDALRRRIEELAHLR